MGDGDGDGVGGEFFFEAFGGGESADAGDEATGDAWGMGFGAGGVDSIMSGCEGVLLAFENVLSF